MRRGRAALIGCATLCLVAAAPVRAMTDPAAEPGLSFGRPNDVGAVSGINDGWTAAPSIQVFDAYGASGTIPADTHGPDYFTPPQFDVLAAESYESAEPQSLLPYYDPLGRRITYKLAPDNSLIRHAGPLDRGSIDTITVLSDDATSGGDAITARDNGFMIKAVDSSERSGGGSVLSGGFLPLVAIGSTPEPASWMTMILGFGMTGAALRGRKAQSALPKA